MGPTENSPSQSSEEDVSLNLNERSILLASLTHQIEYYCQNILSKINSTNVPSVSNQSPDSFTREVDTSLDNDIQSLDKIIDRYNNIRDHFE